MRSNSIRIIKFKRGGKEFVDVRKKSNGETTKKGFSIPSDQVDKIVLAMLEASYEEQEVNLL